MSEEDQLALALRLSAQEHRSSLTAPIAMTSAPRVTNVHRGFRMICVGFALSEQDKQTMPSFVALVIVVYLYVS